MPDLNRPAQRIDASRFSMVPRQDVPRSTFMTQHTHKTTFDAGVLIPILVDEVLPGDVHQGNVTIFARLATPLFPIMDQLELETFFFFVPNRIVWDNWVKMMGERTNPADIISYQVPYVTSPANGWPVNGLQDYMGLPYIGGGLTYHANALPMRMYNLIWNEWFRDQNIQDSIAVTKGNGPDNAADYTLQRRGKKHDYFTSALPWPLKGGVEVPIPLLGQALVKGIAVSTGTATPTAGNFPGYEYVSPGVRQFNTGWPASFSTGAHVIGFLSDATNGSPHVYADLTTASGATLNALRLAIQTQRLLERDARSGSRYVELLQAHFGVTPEDSRLQRPEYIGGGRTPIQTTAIAQTSATNLTGGATPLGALGAAATATDRHSFSYNATEHGFIIGLVNVRAELTYQQGRHRMWSRKTRYDYYWPVFAQLGEQVLRQDEIYLGADSDTAMATGPNAIVFGYQERWAEYRHRPSRISGLFRSTVTGNIDEWHLATQFGSAPVLNNAFMLDAPPLSRVLAAGTAANGAQILFDSLFNIKSTRPMPMFSVPGMMDHF